MTDDGFIGFPPGFTPPPPDTDSGTVKHQRPERPDVVFRPIVPGAPPPASAAVPAAAPTPPAPTVAPTWRLRVPGVAEPIDVTTAVVLGRDPTAPPTAPTAVPVSIQDPAKSVSKTHAMVVVTDGALAVHDLDSTNGVWLVVAGAEPLRIQPGAPIAVPSGAELELGEFVIRVDRR